MRRLSAAALTLVALAGWSDQTDAQSTPTGNGLAFGLSVLTVAYDPAGDSPTQFPSRGYGLGGSLAYVVSRHWLLGGEAGVVSFAGDRDLPATAATESIKVRTTNGLHGSIFAGWITSPIGRSRGLGRRGWLGALVGRSKWSGERRMETCPTCAQLPRIPMRSGAFVEPFGVFGGGDANGGGGIRVSYRAYLERISSMHNVVSVGVYFALMDL